MKCLNCKKELEQTAGKREKKFCNNTCRSNYWQKENRKKEDNPYKMYASGLHPAVKQIKDYVQTELKKEKKGVEPKEGSLAWYLKHGNEQK